MERKIVPGCEPKYFLGNDIGCLLLHGFKSSPYEMHLLGEILNKEGYSVSIPLLPGHGTSPKDLSKCKWYDWFEASKNELFNLRKRCKKVFVIGLSMGGSLALHLAAHYQVEGVVALAPGLFLKNKFSKIVNHIKPLLRFISIPSKPDVKAKVEVITYKKIPIRPVYELLKFFSHLINDLPEIYVPILIIYSKKDHVIDSKSATKIYDKISSKNKSILELKKSYHILTLDIEKEKVFSETSNFIKQLCP